MTSAVRRLAVVGQPISHSLSPVMHTAALQALGLDGQWTYEAIEVAPENFEKEVRALPERGFVGINVTIPHKQAALAVADSASEAATEIGAANTLSFKDGSILAENTDAPGLVAALPRSPAGLRALILGAGGAGRAAAWALAREGAEVEIWNRTASRAEELAAEFGLAVAAGPIEARSYEVIVNATAIGLNPAPGRKKTSTKSLPDSSSVPFPVDQLSESHLVVDLVYGTAPTYLVAEATKQGAEVVDGIEMLVQQGAKSFRLWTGVDPPLEAMRRVAASETF